MELLLVTQAASIPNDSGRVQHDAGIVLRQDSALGPVESVRKTRGEPGQCCRVRPVAVTGDAWSELTTHMEMSMYMKTFFAIVTIALIMVTAPAGADEQPFSTATLDQLLASGQPVAVDFHADWCPTCRAQAPIIRQLLSTPEFKNLTILIANYDTELALRKSLNVAKQSTLVVFRHGKEVARSTGDTSREGLAGLLRQAVT